MTETQVRQRVVDVMKAWVGHVQGSAGHKDIIDTYNNHRPLARGYKVTYSDPWCATTVSAAGILAGYTDIMPTECSCNEMIKLYQKMGRWEENDAYRPQPGDIMMYDWDDNGVGDNKGSADHVGMVEDVNGNTITVIEGNMSKKVGRRTMQVNGKYIRGYCLPDYSKKVTLSPNEITINNAVADGVITMPEYWANVLCGKQIPSAANVKALMDKYHEKVKK